MEEGGGSVFPGLLFCKVNLDEFTALADSVINREVPPVLVRDLNLGIVVLPEEKDDGDFFILGEYITEELGSYIALYYGSFARTLEGETPEVWKREIRETIKHELRHHVESLAGDEKLAREEMKELESMRGGRNYRNDKAGQPGPIEKLFQLFARFFKSSCM